MSSDSADEALVLGPLKGLWGDESFRKAVRDLVSLSADQMAVLGTMTRDGFRVPLTQGKDLGLTPRRFSNVLAALGTLYQLSTPPVSGDVPKLLEVLAEPNEAFADIDWKLTGDALGRLLRGRPSFGPAHRPSRGCRQRPGRGSLLWRGSCGEQDDRWRPVRSRRDRTV